MESTRAFTLRPVLDPLEIKAGMCDLMLIGIHPPPVPRIVAIRVDVDVPVQEVDKAGATTDGRVFLDPAVHPVIQKIDVKGTVQLCPTRPVEDEEAEGGLYDHVRGRVPSNIRLGVQKFPDE